MSEVTALADPVCPSCGAAIHAGDAFCEACGATVDGATAVAAPPEAPAVGAEAGAADALSAAAGGVVAATFISAAPRSERPHAEATPCLVCGGAVAGDGYCETCGTKARTWRDHWTESPAPWLGAVCDRGVRHSRNEDAMATMASAEAPPHPDSLAVLVVCDGVTSAPDSDQASLAASVDARDHLVAAARSTSHTSGAAAIEAMVHAITASCRIAQVAVTRVTDRLIAESPTGTLSEPPSCTFVAAVVADGRATVGWCGDSRAYWLGDDGSGLQLSHDHSLASELIAGGMTRAQAEQDPTANTITRWLGIDSPSPTADTMTFDLPGPGWVMVCSDGMWNYASEPSQLSALMAQAVADGATTPTTIAESMAAFANNQGGADNIAVILARIEQNPEPVPNKES